MGPRCDRSLQGARRTRRIPVPEGNPQASPKASPLNFAGHLNGAADVPRLQAEVGVEVFTGGDGCGVGGAGGLLHRSLGGPQDRAQCSGGWLPGPALRPPAPWAWLTPL